MTPGSLDFLTPVATSQGVVARSPMEPLLRTAGARFAVRDGWNVAASLARDNHGERPVWWADTSHVRKLELQAPAAELDADERLRLGEAIRDGGAWWCRLAPERALVIGGSSPLESAVDATSGYAEGSVDATSAYAEGSVDVTCAYAAITVGGPAAREAIARFCALDLRPAVAPVGALRPGSVARTPGIVIREADDRYLLLFGWALGEYMWSVVSDAGEHLGGAPVGIDALGAVESA